MPNKESRKYRELKQRFKDAENCLLHLDRGGNEINATSFAEARDAYLVAKHELNRFLDDLRREDKEICPNYDRVVESIPGAASRKCEIHPDTECGGFTNRKGNCKGQFQIIQNAKRKSPYTPDR